MNLKPSRRLPQLNSLRTISLFSGCGGLDFGAEGAGLDIVFANDSDKDACATLSQYFPRAEIAHSPIVDIRTFPKAEIVIGGYPCQSFSMGGKRDPERDARTLLYLEFARCVAQVQPKFFLAENVSGLQKLRDGRFLNEQVQVFHGLGDHGYSVFHQILDAKDYGVPQTRKRLFLVGVRRDLALSFRFPSPSHGKPGAKESRGLLPFTSHGEAIKHLPDWPSGEFYERPHDPDGHFSWYYMSRNRKAPWDGPAYTVVANWRHVTLHPAGPVMKLTWSNLADGFKQRWDFADEYEHLEAAPLRKRLKEARRLSWRECAAIQTFPDGFEPVGDVESKFSQIGNAVPPRLAQAVLTQLISGEGLMSAPRYSVNEQHQAALALGI